MSKKDQLLILPLNELCQVKTIKFHGDAKEYATTGSNVDVGLLNVEVNMLTVGSVLCDPLDPIPMVTTFKAQIVTFNPSPPLLRGTQVGHQTNKRANKPTKAEKKTPKTDKELKTSTQITQRNEPTLTQFLVCIAYAKYQSTRLHKANYQYRRHEDKRSKTKETKVRFFAYHSFPSLPSLFHAFPISLSLTLFRCLTKSVSANVVITLDKPICMDLYSKCKPLGRFTMREAGKTLAAGVVTKIIS